MFEEYLEDAYIFALHARECKDDREAKRFYRASVFYAASAIEAFINFIGDTLIKGDTLESYEVALLTDKKFGLMDGHFQVIEKFTLYGIEEKIRFLLNKFDPTLDLSRFAPWSQYNEFKDFRNNIVHPVRDEDERTTDDYYQKIRMGLSSVTQLMNHLCVRIFKKPLRKRILDLTI